VNNAGMTAGKKTPDLSHLKFNQQIHLAFQSERGYSCGTTRVVLRHADSPSFRAQ